MNIQVTFQFDNAAEAGIALGPLFNWFTPPVKEVVANANKFTGPQLVKDDAPAPATSEPPKALTIDDLKTAVTQLSAAVGVPATRELFKKFEVTRAIDLPVAKYAEFIAEAKAMEAAAAK